MPADKKKIPNAGNVSVRGMGSGKIKSRELTTRRVLLTMCITLLLVITNSRGFIYFSKWINILKHAFNTLIKLLYDISRFNNLSGTK